MTGMYSKTENSFLRVHYGNTGVKRTPNKSQHTKLTLEKKILSPLLPGLELATSRSRVRRCTSWTIPAHIKTKQNLANKKFAWFSVDNAHHSQKGRQKSERQDTRRQASLQSYNILTYPGRKFVGLQVVFWAQSTTREYIRAEGDFRKAIYSWKDQ